MCSGTFTSCGPFGTAMDRSGSLYVADAVNGYIYKFGPSGGAASAATQLATPSSLGGLLPVGLAFGKDGNLYVNLAGAGAVVQLKNSKTLQVRSFITQTDGMYHFSGLRSDIDYQLTAKSGDLTAGPRTLSIFDNRKDAVMNFKLEKK